MENLPNAEVQGQSATRYRVYYVSPVQTPELLTDEAVAEVCNIWDSEQVVDTRILALEGHADLPVGTKLYLRRPPTMVSGVEYVSAYALESWLRNRPGTLISAIETTWSA